MFERGLSETLRWYIGARGRLKLGPFNWMLFFGFLPLLFWQAHVAMEMANEVRGFVTGGGLQNMQNLLNLASGGGEQHTLMQKIIPALPYVLMLGLWPAFRMRLRDIGWNINWANVMLAGSVFGLLNVMGLSIPFILRLCLGCIEFYLITMLALKKSA